VKKENQLPTLAQRINFNERIFSDERGRTGRRPIKGSSALREKGDAKQKGASKSHNSTERQKGGNAPSVRGNDVKLRKAPSQRESLGVVGRRKKTPVRRNLGKKAKRPRGEDKFKHKFKV